jgi:uncharacterized protein (TIGR01777 family)
MYVLITGGTGTIGRRLVQHLIKQGHVVTIVSRQAYRPATLPAKIEFAQWDGKTATGWGHLVEEADAILNLAGAGIADTRWSDERKQVLVDSRINAGKAISEAIGAAAKKPGVLIQASAVGYYGIHGDETITESDGPADDFLGDLCEKWEASSTAVEEMGVRRVVIRIGVVLDTLGGALPRMLLPYRFFVGGRVGSGRQWVSWIHYYDLVAAILFLIEQGSASEAFNLTAPSPVQNRDLAKAIGQAMHRPSALPAPGFALKAAFGEMSTVLLDGQRVLPERLLAMDFEFKYATAADALEDLVGKPQPAEASESRETAEASNP